MNSGLEQPTPALLRGHIWEKLEAWVQQCVRQFPNQKRTERYWLGTRWTGVRGFGPLISQAKRRLVKVTSRAPSGSAMNKASAVLNRRDTSRC